MTTTTTSNPEAERTVLGAILRGNVYALDLSGAHLTVEDFHAERHRRIYRALNRIAEHGERMSVATLRAELVAASELEAVGGENYLHYLADDPQTVERAVEDIREAALARAKEREAALAHRQAAVAQHAARVAARKAIP